MLGEAFLCAFDEPACAMSREGDTFIGNAALYNFFEPLFPEGTLPRKAVQDGEDSAEQGADLDGKELFAQLKLYDADFKTLLPHTEYPLYRVSFLGEHRIDAILGIEGPSGKRMIIETSSRGLFHPRGPLGHVSSCPPLSS